MNRAWIEVDFNALQHNLEVFQRAIPKGCKIMGVVKANAYGHGDVLVAKWMEQFGTDCFAVAAASEAVKLRKAGIGAEILILGYTAPEDFHLLVEYDLTQAAVDMEHAKALSAFGGNIKVHVAVDTGMHRLGIPADDIEGVVSVYQMPGIRVAGLFSHLCAADTNREDDVAFSRQQIEKFKRVMQALKDRGIDPGITHTQASYASVNYRDIACDYVRLGILMYGAKSSYGDYMDLDEELQPVLSLKAKVTSVREVAVGESIGYGRAYVAERPMRIASLAVGYADGISRALSNGKMSVLIRGQKAVGVGRICMDQMMVDVTEIPGVCAGDSAVLIGRDGAYILRAEDMAEAANSITNETLSCLGVRLDRMEKPAQSAT